MTFFLHLGIIIKNDTKKHAMKKIILHGHAQHAPPTIDQPYAI